MTLASLSQLGPYQVQSLVGSGSMGEVYRARDTRLDREVAIKVIRSTDSTEDVRRRFLQEAKAVSALNHPNIVTIHDVGEEAGILYIVTEYIHGVPLRETIRRGALPIRTVLDFGIQITDGLAAAHEAGIIHRDLKPENIMVTNEGRAKILDFGIAKAASNDLADLEATLGGNETAPGIVLGTAAYMSPEQARGGRVSFWSDQFSLGAILYEMTTGQSPFKRETGLQTLSAILMEEAPLLSQGSPAFQWLVKRCLHKEPDHRYASTVDVLRELQSIRGQMTDTTEVEVADNPTVTQPAAVPSAVIATVAEPRQRDWVRVVWLGLLLLASAVTGFLGSRLLPARTRAEIPTDYRPLATSPGMDVDPSWSPNGRAVAYASERNGLFQIFIRSLHSPVATQLTFLSGQCLAPFWSPDGSRIYFLSDNDLWNVSAAGGSPQKLVDNALAAAVSADGQTLAMVRREPNGDAVSLWTGPLRTLQMKRYSAAPLPSDRLRAPAHIQFSPDAKQLGAWFSTERGPEFWSIPWPAGAPRQLQLHAASALTAPDFSWLSDSRHIVFSDQAHLWETDVFNNTIQAVSAGTGTEWTPSASRQSGTLAFAAATLNYDITTFPINGGPGHVESPTATRESYPTTSISGDMAYVSNRSGAEEIWISSNDNERTLITQSSFGDLDLNGRATFADLAFSPDGRRLAYTRTDGTGSAIWISAITGDSPVRVTPASSEVQSNPTWGSDGNSLAYASIQKGVPVVKMARLGGLEPPTVIATNAGSGALWSPNGVALATINPSGGLYLLSPDGATRKALSSGKWLVHCWSKDGLSLYGIKQTAARSLLLTKLSTTTGTEATITDLGSVPAAFAYAATVGARPYTGLTFSADGKSLVTSALKADSDIWLLERGK